MPDHQIQKVYLEISHNGTFYNRIFIAMSYEEFLGDNKEILFFLSLQNEEHYSADTVKAEKSGNSCKST